MNNLYSFLTDIITTEHKSSDRVKLLSAQSKRIFALNVLIDKKKM